MPRPLHSEAGRAWVLRHSVPYRQRPGVGGTPHFHVKLGNNGPKFFSAHQIYTFYFRSMIDNFERSGGRQVQNIVAVIPASLNPSQYQSELSAAATEAGVRIVYFIERSVLAASSYKCLYPSRCRTVLVFELGGRILEISLLAQNGGLNKTASVFDLGCPLLNHMISLLSSSSGAIDFNRDAYFLRELRTKCERAKDALCLGSGPVEIEIQREGLAVKESIDRELLVQMNLDQLRSGIMTCLTDAGVRQEAVDEVVLVGASSTIPEVLGVILEFFQRKSIRSEIDPAKLIYLSSMRCLKIVSTRLNTTLTGLRTFNLGIYSI